MRADADDAELAEADVAAPAGEDHERHADHRPHDRRSAASSWLLGAQPVGTKTNASATTSEDDAPSPSAPRAGRRSSSGIGLTHAGGRPRRRAASPAPGDSLPRWSSRAPRITTRNDDVWNDGVPALFQRTTCSMMPRPMPAPNASGQRLHAGDDRGGQARAAARSGPLAPRRASTPANGALSMKVSAASAAGDHPHDRRQPPDRDAEQQGAVDVLGRGPHGRCRRRSEQEPGQPGDDRRARPA